MTERILITGAQGFLGRYVAAQWLTGDPGATVVGIGRSPRCDDAFTHTLGWGAARVPAPLPQQLGRAGADARYRYQPLDLVDRPALVQMLRTLRPHAIVHLAAALRDEPADVLIEANVRGTLSLLEAVGEAAIPAPRVLLGSSGGVYGSPADDALPIREQNAGAPIDLYSATKRAAEDVARIAARAYGIPLVIARIFNVVGPGQDERHLCARLTGQLAEIRKGLRAPTLEIGSLETTRDFVDVRDVAAALRVLVAAGAPGASYNVGSGRETSVRDVLELALRVAGCGDAVQIHEGPGRAADIPRHFADIGALRALGFEPAVSLAESLEDLLRYYMDVVSASAAVAPAEAARPATRLEVRADAPHRYEVEVEVGLLDRLPVLLRERFAGARMVVLTDDRVESLYGARFARGLGDAGVRADVVVVPAGEESKSFACYRDVLEQLHAHQFDRRALLVNLGGGLVTDLGGFVAATYLRGVAYVNVPTTLLAQHDSAIGGKVAVNTAWAKNFIGAFHHPRAVFCDPAVLATLSERDLAAGIAESLKVALTGDVPLFELLESRAATIRETRDAQLLGEVVRRSAEQKIRLLAPDPYEVDLRRPLNLGHTFGHPLEVELGYASILHGEAVAFGLAVATAIAHARGVCPRPDAERIYRVLVAYGLPPSVSRASLRAVCGRLREIRLVRANQLHFVLPEAIGSVRIVPELEDAEFERAIDAIAREPLLAGCVIG